MRRDRLLLVLLLVLGAFLRLHDLGSMEFKADEQEALNLGIGLLSDRPWATSAAWPAAGMPSSNGIDNAPLFNWLMAAFWSMTGDPVRATALIALANLLC